MESFFEEMKRYVRFGAEDEAALRALADRAVPHFRRIAIAFYDRLHEHDEARAVFSGPAQVEHLKGKLCEWLALLFRGPWDEAYYQMRARIGRTHVRISLPQRYMFGAMNLIRFELVRIAQDAYPDDEAKRVRVVAAIGKVVDLELAIMLETYREAFVEKVQRLEREEKENLAQALALSEARYEEIVEKSEALIVTATVDGAILLFNGRCEELTGLRRAEATGRNWMEIFAPEVDRPALRAQRARVLAGERVPPYESTFTTRSGAHRRIRWHFTTLPGKAGPILCKMGIDVTEEHELGARTRRAERLAALGTMAAGLAHEIRNPLNAAHLQLTLVQRRLGRASGAEAAAAASAAALASSEIQRLAMLVEEFLQFARPQPLRVGRGDLRATAEAVLALLAPEAASAGIELALEPGQAVDAEYDDERIKQVLLNLVRNAVEATGRGGHVRLQVASQSGFALLEVADDGKGLPTSDVPIFEPFFTTKENGTGLGLAIVHRIVNDHGGRIEVQSRPARTVFSVWLPFGRISAQNREVVG